MHSLENWINEYVDLHAKDYNGSLAPSIRRGFDNSMQANIDYHKAVAQAFDVNGDKELVKYHNMMSNVYGSLLS